MRKVTSLLVTPFVATQSYNEEVKSLLIIWHRVIPPQAAFSRDAGKSGTIAAVVALYVFYTYPPQCLIESGF